MASKPALQSLRIGMIPGDGIGRQVLPAAGRVLQAVGGIPTPSFVQLEAGFELFKKTGTALPEETVRTLREECNCAMFGAVSSPSHKVQGYSSPIVALRKKLDLYANIRPVKAVSGTGTRQVDMTIVRENTECLYVKEETIRETPDGKVAEAIRRISEWASRRIGKMAFEVALRGKAVNDAAPAESKSHHTKPKVTIVHKSNVLSTTDGLFRETVRAVKEQGEGVERYREVELDEQIVDSLVYKLFREPEKLSTLVCPNLYGDIVSDGAAALVGSLGLVASINAGDTFVMGEPVHGSAPDIADSDPPIANPIAAIRSAALMLEHLDFAESAAKIYRAVDQVLREGKTIPRDLGGKATTEQVTEAVLAGL